MHIVVRSASRISIGDYGGTTIHARDGGLLAVTYCTDSTDMRAISADQDESKCSDPTDDGVRRIL